MCLPATASRECRSSFPATSRNYRFDIRSKRNNRPRSGAGTGRILGSMYTKGQPDNPRYGKEITFLRFDRGPDDTLSNRIQAELPWLSASPWLL